MGLHALPFLAAEVDEDYLARYLTLANIPIAQTIFRHVHRLPSGCAMSVRREKTRLWRHCGPTASRIFASLRPRTTSIVFASGSIMACAHGCARQAVSAPS